MFSLDHQTNQHLVVWYRDQIPRFSSNQVAGYMEGIAWTDPEANECADIAEQRVKDCRLDLTQILVGECERQAVFAQLLDRVGHGAGVEGVEFVDVDEKRAAVPFWDFVPAEGRVAHAREDHAAKDVGNITTNLTFAKGDDQDLPLVNDLAEPKGVLRFDERSLDNGMRKERAQLVGN